MNEEEYKRTYDAAFEAATRVAGPETRTSLFHILCLIEGLRADMNRMKEPAKDG